MNFIWDKITEWLKGLLVSGIISNLSGLFDAINTRVGEAAAVVGTTPQAWHGGIFQMIRSLSENVVVPIAGIILTFIMCLELISQPRIKNDGLCFDISDKIVVDVNVAFFVIVHGIAFADLNFLNQAHQRGTV